MNAAVEWERLLERNSDLDGSPCELCEWSQADLMQLITMAQAELTMRHEARGLPDRGCKHEHGSGLMDTNGHGEFTCYDCGAVLVLGRGLSNQPGEKHV